MKKYILLMLGISFMAFGIIYGVNQYQKNKTNELISLNVESLTTSEVPGTGDSGIGLTIRVCSKKTGTYKCSERRGYRKWAFNLRLAIHSFTGNCPECPDQDFDSGEDGIELPDYKIW